MQTNHLSLIKWIWQVYDRIIHVMCLHQPQQHSWGLAWSPRRSLPLHPCWALHSELLQIFSVLATERLTTRGWGSDLLILLMTYANHVHFYNLWFTYDGLLMIHLYFTYVLLMIYLWFTYDLFILLMTYLYKSCFLFFTYNLPMIYLYFMFYWLLTHEDISFLWFTCNILLIYLCLINSLNYALLLIY